MPFTVCSKEMQQRQGKIRGQHFLPFITYRISKDFIRNETCVKPLSLSFAYVIWSLQLRCRTVVLPSFVDIWDLQFGFEWNNSGTPCDGRDILIDLLVLKCRKGPDQDCRRFQTLCPLSFKKCDWWQTCLACLACSRGKPLLSNLPCRRSAPATAARASSNKIMRICANHRYLVCFCCSHDFDC